MAAREFVMVDEPEESFYFGRNFCFPDPIESDEVGFDVTLICICQYVVGTFA